MGLRFGVKQAMKRSPPAIQRKNPSSLFYLFERWIEIWSEPFWFKLGLVISFYTLHNTENKPYLARFICSQFLCSFHAKYIFFMSFTRASCYKLHEFGANRTKQSYFNYEQKTILSWNEIVKKYWLGVLFWTLRYRKIESP